MQLGFLFHVVKFAERHLTQQPLSGIVPSDLKKVRRVIAEKLMQYESKFLEPFLWLLLKKMFCTSLSVDQVMSAKSLDPFA